ncbi:MAG: tRNA 2-thiouridine(34) synthase MnmA [Clostridiales bacterium]|nr:tRNA 2-thiouridine(34) synthase MnmA [Clostridiales bacterium]
MQKKMNTNSRKVAAAVAENKVVLGLSGGVDSTAAALLLKEKGFEVTGLYFDVTTEADEKSEKSRAAAEKAAKEMDIDFVYKNVSREFNETVLADFCDEYLSGRTPNPCIICNPLIKFKTLKETADAKGARYISTGHYASVVFREDVYYIKTAANKKKDQSYMLYRLPQEILSGLILPLGDFESKDDIRKFVKENDLSNADSPDSQEICFIDSDEGYAEFFRKNGYAAERGDFIDMKGDIIGSHKGIINYTVGQRKGLGGTFGRPMFVTRLDAKNNTVTLGEKEDLYSYKVFSGGNFFTETECKKMPSNLENKKVLAKVRYSAKPSFAVIRTVEEKGPGADPEGFVIETLFEEKQKAVTPGQSIVFYYPDGRVAGGGFIK